jgi:hypothetical protein
MRCVVVVSGENGQAAQPPEPGSLVGVRLPHKNPFLEFRDSEIVFFYLRDLLFQNPPYWLPQLYKP